MTNTASTYDSVLQPTTTTSAPLGKYSVGTLIGNTTSVGYGSDEMSENDKWSNGSELKAEPLPEVSLSPVFIHLGKMLLPVLKLAPSSNANAFNFSIVSDSGKYSFPGRMLFSTSEF